MKRKIKMLFTAICSVFVLSAFFACNGESEQSDKEQNGSDLSVSQTSDVVDSTDENVLSPITNGGDYSTTENYH